jgi:hypothetical protein
MVPGRRPGLYPRIIMYGPINGPRYRIPIFRIIAEKVGSIPYMGGYDVLFRRHIPVVFLGLFPRFQHHGEEWLHR